jgi:hypothetical protein
MVSLFGVSCCGATLTTATLRWHSRLLQDWQIDRSAVQYVGAQAEYPECESSCSAGQGSAVCLWRRVVEPSAAEGASGMRGDVCQGWRDVGF